MNSLNRRAEMEAPAGLPERTWQGCDPDEPYDPLKCAIWAALVPFQNELLATGGVTFMGLRNSIVEAVRSFAIASQREATAPSAKVHSDLVRLAREVILCIRDEDDFFELKHEARKILATVEPEAIQP